MDSVEWVQVVAVLGEEVVVADPDHLLISGDTLAYGPADSLMTVDPGETGRELVHCRFASVGQRHVPVLSWVSRVGEK